MQKKLLFLWSMLTLWWCIFDNVL